MKRTPLLNTALSEVISKLGHMDKLVVADAGLPVPKGTQRIDLALTRGIPSFVDALRVVLQEMQVESIIMAEETGQVSPQVLKAVDDLLPGIAYRTVPHARFKDLTGTARAVVRTGEFTPYANIILVSGISF